jgi:CHAT domain-containing protein
LSDVGRDQMEWESYSVFEPALGPDPDEGGLFHLMLAPVEATLLSAGTEHLILSPSGVTQHIPWAALWHEDADGQHRWLSQDYAISLTPTPTSLWLLRRGAAISPKDHVRLLAAAPFAPDSDEESNSQSVRDGRGLLPGTRIEVESVRSLVRESQRGDGVAFVGHEVTRSAVESAAAAVTLLLLTTHGLRLSDGQSVLDFGLLFRDDEILRVVEVYRGDLRLAQAMQVALTACHLGQIADRGDGIIGFAQAFLSTGARTVLAPMWAVDDVATCLLSIAHHQGLLADDRPSVAEAWRQAMAEVRSKPGWEHPFFWAAFLPSGDGAVRLPSAS